MSSNTTNPESAAPATVSLFDLLEELRLMNDALDKMTAAYLRIAAKHAADQETILDLQTELMMLKQGLKKRKH